MGGGASAHMCLGCVPVYVRGCIWGNVCWCVWGVHMCMIGGCVPVRRGWEEERPLTDKVGVVKGKKSTCGSASQVGG